MPCNSDYMEPNNREIDASKMFTFLEEIKHSPLKDNEVTKKRLRGYHPKVYMQHPTKEVVDALTAELCTLTKELDVTKYSLELQIWVRDHKLADEAREENQ